MRLAPVAVLAISGFQRLLNLALLPPFRAVQRFGFSYFADVRFWQFLIILFAF